MFEHIIWLILGVMESFLPIGWFTHDFRYTYFVSPVDDTIANMNLQ